MKNKSSKQILINFLLSWCSRKEKNRRKKLTNNKKRKITKYRSSLTENDFHKRRQENKNFKLNLTLNEQTRTNGKDGQNAKFFNIFYEWCLTSLIIFSRHFFVNNLIIKNNTQISLLSGNEEQLTKLGKISLFFF